MARRTSVRRYDTEEVQGEGSFVVLSSMKVKEVRALRLASKQAKAAGEDDGDAAFEGGLKILADHIVDWDWVDDGDKPLPLPKDDPNVVDELTNDEADFLSDLLTDGGQETKN